MKKKQEKKYFNRHWKKMQVHLEAFLNTHDQEELHEFRVHVKKLKSLLTLFESGYGNGQLLKCFKPVKKIFRKAGIIRSAFINMKLSDQYHGKSVDFVTRQQGVIEEGIKEFSANGKTFLKRIKKVRLLINRRIHHLGNTAIKRIYKTNLDQINVFLQKPEFNDRLHTCRKQIKFLLHNEKTAGDALKNQIRLDTAYLDHLQDSIGKWHDNVLAIETFSSIESGDASIVRQVKTENRKLQKDIAREGTNFKDRAVNTLKGGS